MQGVRTRQAPTISAANYQGYDHGEMKTMVEQDAVPGTSDEIGNVWVQPPRVPRAVLVRRVHRWVQAPDVARVARTPSTSVRRSSSSPTPMRSSAPTR